MAAEGEEFVQRWYHVVVLDIGHTADMDEIAPPAIHDNLTDLLFESEQKFAVRKLI
jgi:hypothetical protein